MQKGQNLIEFIIVIPILIVIIFGIIEFSIFWKTSQTVQEIALQAAAAAASQYVAETDTSNAAVNAAVAVVQSRAPSLGITNLKPLKPNPQAGFGTAPFALYEATSVETRGNECNPVPTPCPLIDLTVDYRNPYASYTDTSNNGGIVTQLSYSYQTILLGAQFTLPGGTIVTIIPNYINISSTKIQQYNNY